MMELMFIRHLPTAWNKKGMLQGRMDIDLTEDAAIHLADVIARNVALIAAFKPEVCIVSPLRRAVATAILHHVQDFLIDDRVIEFDFGFYEGCKKEDMVKSLGSFWHTDIEKLELGEKFSSFQKRIDDFIADVKVKWKRVLLISHGFVLRYLKAQYQLKDISLMNLIQIDNNELVKLHIN
jgi:broad specificity phosphatase PhoE